MSLENPILTRDMFPKREIDLTDYSHLALEAHELASYAVDLIEEILELDYLRGKK